MTEEIRQKLTGAVIGLARTCENNEKTESTDRVFLEALTMAGDWSASIFDMSEMLEKVRNEKYTVSPGCVTCAAPCGTACSAILRLRKPCISGIRCAAASGCILRRIVGRLT